MKEYQIIRLEAQLIDEVADLYARVFAGPPWYEIKKCPLCNETYGKEDDLKNFQNGTPCRRCGKPLELIDYWYGGPAHQVFENAISLKGFVGVGARYSYGGLVAFSWGYAVPEENTPTVLFKDVNGLLLQKGIDARSTFYAAETGVDPQFQTKGIGTEVMYARFKAAAETGFHGICGRTINPKLVERYERFFGKENVIRVFNDPDPVKADRIWYYCPLQYLKELEG